MIGVFLDLLDEAQNSGKRSLPAPNQGPGWVFEPLYGPSL